MNDGLTTNEVDGLHWTVMISMRIGWHFGSDDECRDDVDHIHSLLVIMRIMVTTRMPLMCVPVG